MVFPNNPASFNGYLSDGGFAELKEFFAREGTSAHYAAGDCFSVQGRRNRSCGLIRTGAFRYVHATAAGDDHVVGYAFAGEFVGDYISMCNGRPAWVRIESMCPCEVLQVPNGRIEEFYRSDCRRERLGRRVAERLMAELYERLLQFYACSPQERYESLVRRCPGLLDMVALKELASYLRVRPETLSRIRSRMR